MSRRLPRDTRLTCPDCGYTTPLQTEAMATYALRKHSCAMTLERQRRTAAAAARRVSSGVVRDCEHKVARHVHGTRNAYVLDRCRCRPCRDATAAHTARVTRAQAYGQWAPFVDAEPVREHLATLTASGLGLKRIAAAAGVTQSVVTAIVYGKKGVNRPPTRRVRRQTADALLAVRADLGALGASIPVDPTGTRRRLQALVAAGWSITELGRRLGITNINRTLNDADSGVRADTARRTRDLYEQLWDVAPPERTHRERISASASRNYAAKRGWLPALAWDDDTIDDPAAWGDLGGDGHDLVDEEVVRRLVDAFPERVWRDLGATKAERVAAAEQLDAAGRRTRAHLSLRDQADTSLAGPNRSAIERALGVKPGRDFAVRDDVREAVAS